MHPWKAKRMDAKKPMIIPLDNNGKGKKLCLITTAIVESMPRVLKKSIKSRNQQHQVMTTNDTPLVDCKVEARSRCVGWRHGSVRR